MADEVKVTWTEPDKGARCGVDGCGDLATKTGNGLNVCDHHELAPAGTDVDYFKAIQVVRSKGKV